MTFTPHPKAPRKAKKPGAMKTKPKAAKPVEMVTTVSTAATTRKLPKVPKSAPKEHQPQSKTDLIIAMLKKPGGASSKEMEAATGWKPHSVRGLLGTLRSKGTLIKAEKFAKGEPTVYSIDASAPAALPSEADSGEVI